jgi:hypothetical protein
MVGVVEVRASSEVSVGEHFGHFLGGGIADGQGGHVLVPFPAVVDHPQGVRLLRHCPYRLNEGGGAVGWAKLQDAVV